MHNQWLWLMNTAASSDLGGDEGVPVAHTCVITHTHARARTCEHARRAPSLPGECSAVQESSATNDLCIRELADLLQLNIGSLALTSTNCVFFSS